ncbi:Transgelin [Yarrowia sp. B02]|nr:Transgelin [Yarrowia sp. B02]
MPKNVSSLDSDLSELRASKYDGASTAEVSAWISTVIGEDLPQGEDLMDVLRDGTILCKLANTIKPGCATAKKSAMPFVQMENIASFLKAASFLGVPQHELFETVDMYELRDPAQVLVCLKALSRHAHKVNPDIPVMGPKLGAPSPNAGKKNFKADTSGPAWNTHQYGYMGGASQGSEKVVFGGRRDIVTDEKTEEAKKININFGSGGSGGSNEPGKKKGPPPIPSKPKHLKGFDQGEHEDDEDEVEDMRLQTLKSKQQTAQAEQDYDASVYAYDDVYEDIHEEKSEPKAQLTQSKHLDGLLVAKRKREEDRLAASETKLKRLRANEGDMYDDKEKFVTPAYKRQQEALKKEREKEAAEGRNVVTSFYDIVDAMAGNKVSEEKPVTKPAPEKPAPAKPAPASVPASKPKPLPAPAPPKTEKVDKVAAARARFLARKKGVK